MFQIWRATKTKPVLSAGSSLTSSSSPTVETPLLSCPRPTPPPSLKDSLLVVFATAPGLGGPALVVGEADVRVTIVARSWALPAPGV